MENIINAVVSHQHATESKWGLSSYVPEAGEIVIYDADATHNYTRQKVGDGLNKVKDLPFTLGGKSDSEEYITEEKDPTVPAWAKASTKPNYTANEVGAVPVTRTINGESLDKDVIIELGDLASDAEHRTVTDAEKAVWNRKSDFSGSYDDLTNKPNIPSIEGLATEEYVRDNMPKSLADLTDDAGHRTVTDIEKAAWNGKSDFSGSYNDLTDKPEIPSIPEALKNPLSIKFSMDNHQGEDEIVGEYDGSEELWIKAGDNITITKDDNALYISAENDMDPYVKTIAQEWQESNVSLAFPTKTFEMPHPEARLIENSAKITYASVGVLYSNGMSSDEVYYTETPFEIKRGSSVEQIFEIPIDQIEWSKQIPEGAVCEIDEFLLNIPQGSPAEHKYEYIEKNHYRLSNGVIFNLGSTVYIKDNKVIFFVGQGINIDYSMKFEVELYLKWNLQKYYTQDEVRYSLEEKDNKLTIKLYDNSQLRPSLGVGHFNYINMDLQYDVELPCGLNPGGTPRLSKLEVDAIRPILNDAIVPDTNGTLSFGSASKKWKNIYANYLRGTADNAIHDGSGRNIVNTYAEKTIVEELTERLHNTNSKIYGNTWVLNDTIELDFDLYKRHKLYDFKFTTANGETFYGIYIENTKNTNQSLKGFYKISYKKSSDLDEWIEVYRRDENGSRWHDTIPNSYKIIATLSTINLDTIGVQQAYEGNLSTNSDTIVGAINELTLYGGTGKYIQTEDGKEYWETGNSTADLAQINFGLDYASGIVVLKGLCWSMSKFADILGKGETWGELYDLLGEVADELGDVTSHITVGRFGGLASKGARTLGDKFVLSSENVIQYGDKTISLGNIIDKISNIP